MEIPSDAELQAIIHRVVSRNLMGRGEQIPRGVTTPITTPATPLPEPVSAPVPATSVTGSPARRQMVALGADHGGFPLKETLKKHLEEKGYTVVDCGTHSTDAVDYPDFARAVAVLVGEGKAWRGIMIDGAGIGSCMAANKIPGVRASMCYDHASANNAREHNDANVLTLGAGLLGTNLAKQIVDTWLTTPFAGGRHAKRVDKIIALDR
ncbi:MAG TPA: ribose 5-phosphate isomerase B [Anaerolineales bacterium]|nr:ribose 5-phosphate isomerase B [Anaerolineales bacterium]